MESRNFVLLPNLDSSQHPYPHGSITIDGEIYQHDLTIPHGKGKKGSAEDESAAARSNTSTPLVGNKRRVFNWRSRKEVAQYQLKINEMFQETVSLDFSPRDAKGIYSSAACPADRNVAKW